MLMKRFIILLFITALLLAGCRSESPETGAPVTVYALGGEGDRAALVEHTLFCPEGEDVLAFALRGVLSGAGGHSPFPAGVTVVDTSLNGGVFSVTLSEEASVLSGFPLTLARASIVLTLTALDDGINGVRISVEGQSPEPAILRASDFVLGALVLADTERPIRLFFPDEEGIVMSESRTIVVRETDTVEFYLQLTLEGMIAGPRTEGLLPVLPAGTRLLSVAPEGGGEYAVNLSGEFVTNAEQSRFSTGMILHCLVRSVTSQPGVSAVRLLVEAQPLERYGEKDTSHPLTAADVRLP
jgi:spore germination protein GerM